MEWARVGVQMVIDHFKRPTQDVAPMLLLVLPNDSNEVVALDPQFLVSAPLRLQLTEQVVPKIIQENQAVGACLVLPVWRVKQAQLDQPLELIERDHGEDGVLIQAATADDTKWAIGILQRFTDKIPVIREWSFPEEGMPINEVGLTMCQALRDVAASQN